MKRFIFAISIVLVTTTVFVSCKKDKKKDQSPGTDQPNEKTDYFTFKENGILYKMDKFSLGASNPQGPNPINEFSGYTVVDSYLLPSRDITINFPDSVSPKIGEFVIGGSQGINISYSIEQNNTTTKYNYNQHGILNLEKSIGGLSTKGTLEFVGYTYDGSDSVVITEGKFDYKVPFYN